jgi:predicted MFS family arabinose efflux permease
MLRSSIALYRNAYSGLSAPVWWLALVLFVNRSGTMVIPFLTVYLTTKLHYTIGQAGMIMGLFGAGAMLGAFLGGKLTDRIGFYPVQFASLILNGIMFIVLGQMRTLSQLGICIFILSSLGESFRPANAAAIAWYSEPGNRTRSYSLNRLAINLGWSIGPAIGGILASISYQWLFWVDGLTCILAALMLRLFLPPVRHQKIIHNKDYIPAGSHSAYSDRIYLRFMFFVFLVSICFLQLFSIVPIYFKEQIHMNESAIGMVLALNGIIIVFSEMVLVYKLEGKRNATFYTSLGAIFMGLAFLIFNIAQNVIVVLFSMLVITFGEMMLFPFVNTFWISRSKEQNRGQYAALYTIAFSLAHVLAPTIGSQVVKHFGFSVLWYLVFVICLIASLGFYKLKTAVD